MRRTAATRIDVAALARQGLAVLLLNPREGLAAFAQPQAPAPAAVRQPPKRRTEVETYGYSVGTKLRKVWQRRNGRLPVRLVVALEERGWRLVESDSAALRRMENRHYRSLSPLVVDLYRCAGHRTRRTADGKLFFALLSGLGGGSGRGNAGEGQP